MPPILGSKYNQASKQQDNLQDKLLNPECGGIAVPLKLQ
jgi:hypothetical protein